MKKEKIEKALFSYSVVTRWDQKYNSTQGSVYHFHRPKVKLLFCSGKPNHSKREMTKDRWDYSTYEWKKKMKHDMRRKKTILEQRQMTVNDYHRYFSTFIITDGKVKISYCFQINIYKSVACKTFRFVKDTSFQAIYCRGLNTTLGKGPELRAYLSY